MKNNPITSLVAIVLLSGTAFSQLPESPAIWREVTGIKYKDPLAAPALRNPEHQRPHVPSFRTTRDGRVGINPKTAEFALIMPEKLTGPLLKTQAATKQLNSFVIRNNNSFKDIRLTDPATNQPYANFHLHKAALLSVTSLKQRGLLPSEASGVMEHVTLFDPTPLDWVSGEKVYPVADGLKDTYTIDVVGAFIHDAADPNTPGQMRLWSTTVKVTVTHPKTANANIEKIEKIGDTRIGAPFLFQNASGLELNVVDGGRLIVMRLAGGVPMPGNRLYGIGDWYNIVYSYSTSTAIPINPAKWTVLDPITSAHHDTRINTRLGFALKNFRDAAGNKVPKDSDMGATYPWMDPEAKNLFMTLTDDTLRNHQKFFGTVVNNIYVVNPSIGLQSESRYPHTPTVPGQEPFHSAEKEDFGPTRGVSFAGLWSHGKIVTIDTLNNDMDYQIDGNFFSREVSLYSDIGSTTAAEKTKLTMGGGRVNGSGPLGDVDNTGFIESMRNTYNYNPYAKPVTVRDVVWTMQNPKHTDELAFDDYLDRDALIVANMNGCVMLDANNTLRHQSGFNGGNVKLQNAATPGEHETDTNLTRWKLPQFGDVTGPGRLEPAATGGIHGKGFWLNSTIGVKFAVPQQNPITNVYLHNWYVGLFIDCRDGGERELLTFPDGTGIRLIGYNTIKYVKADGTSNRSVSIATGVGSHGNMIPDPGWAHLAWQIKKGGKEIDFLLNGMLYNRLVLASSDAPLFQIAKDSDRKGGDLTIGNTVDSTPGFMGWIDDFKVIARTVDPESACNHAGGTLVGLRPSYAGELRNFNNSFPTYGGIKNGLAVEEINQRLNHNGQVTYGAYANLSDYDRDRDDHQPDPNISLVVSMRKALHFPEGPIHRTRPRPNSIKNQFCLTCHSSEGSQGLGLAALTYNGALNAPQDPRRTPLQPLRRIFGNIPQNWVNNLPASAGVAPVSGRLIDDYVLSGPGIPSISTFTLVDGNTNQEIALLVPGQTPTVKRSSFSLSPVRKILIRANLNSSHGDVALQLNHVSHSTLTPVGTVLHAGFNIPYANELTGLTNMTHTVSGTPTGGTTVSASFTLIP